MTGRTAVRVMLLWGLAVALLATSPAPTLAQPPPLPDGCAGGLLGKAQILICVPDTWNRDLVVFAHGYVAPTGEPPQIPWDQLELSDGTSIPGIVMSLGFAFATTSYSDDGLAIVEGVQDVQDLVLHFRGLRSDTDHVYLVGASEGGLVTTLAVEQSPLVFSGGVATCGPVGDFRQQVDYWGDFRVLFDYFFPGRLPPSAVDVPPYVRRLWDTDYAPRIERALRNDPKRLNRLLRVGRVPVNPTAPDTNVETALQLLWYNVFATNDAKAKLGGNPFDNSKRLYLGSGSDFWLNLLVRRYYADEPALAAIEESYQTTGRLDGPLLTMHTTGDPIVPYWHEPLYALKALPSGLLHTNLPIIRYGHCSFEAAEALVALGLLVRKVEGRELLNAERVLKTRKARERYRSLARANGLRR
jgi:pimeloyl-ACP methyl ester carboxylesterase